MGSGTIGQHEELELDLTAEEIEEMMRLARYDSGPPYYAGPHAYTVDDLKELWGYNSRASVHARADRLVEQGKWVKVSVPPRPGSKARVGWVLAEIYNKYREAEDGG